MTDLGEIFRLHGPAYREKYSARMPLSHLRAMQAIETCRTESLGGQVYFCPRCCEPHFSYHSCKNRSCPKCQNDQASDWLESQKALLLPVPHFLVTFTIPQELRSPVRSHQKALLSILFRSSAEALQKLGRDPRFLGGKIGLMGVLHTWTRDLLYHPHVHYVVPAGCLAQGVWVPPRTQGFLVPVKALSVLFRAKFRDALKKEDPSLFSSVPSQTWNRDWVVHSEAVGTGEHALAYLARYVFRVAISNNRILSLKDGVVTFESKDPQTKQRRIYRLPADEFIRRFLQHVLPKGFIKVRYYGLFAPNSRALLRTVRELLPAPAFLAAHPKPPERRPPSICPKCGNTMQLIATYPRKPP